jgi:transcription antitermination factor NusG
VSVNWFGLHVRSNHEYLVALRLERAGIESFYPHLVHKSKDNKRDTELKFMPGYVFARFDIEEKTPVVEIEQVVSILGVGRHAIAIPDVEIAAVKLITSFPELNPSPCSYLAEGDRVRVLSGPLRDLEGYVCFVKNTRRLVISVTMMARSISAEVDGDSLALLERAEAPKKLEAISC